MELNIHEIEQTEWERKMDDTHGKAWHDSDRHVELMDILMDIRDALQHACPHCRQRQGETDESNQAEG